MSDEEEAHAAKKPRHAEGPSSASSLPLKTVRIGDLDVCAVGLGLLPAGVAYPSGAPSAETVKAMLRAAATGAAPATLLIDCADTYCTPYSALHAVERLVGSCPLPPGTRLVSSTKAGMKRLSDESSGWRPGSLSPAAVRAGILQARDALCAPGVPLFLFSLHHADGFAASGVLEGALTEARRCVEEGLVLHIGLCNATVPLLQRAIAILPIAACQNEWSLVRAQTETPLLATHPTSSGSARRRSPSRPARRRHPRRACFASAGRTASCSSRTARWAASRRAGASAAWQVSMRR